jgi:hypothetical protein
MQKLSLRLLTSLIFTLLAATISTPSLHANINNIKGTYDILKPEYKQFSVIHGAVAWETGTIRRMYDLGALGKHGDKIKSRTIALVHKIFYRKPGTTSIAEFVATKEIRELTLTDAEVARFVADVLLYLHKLPETELFKKYKETFTALEQADKKKKPILTQTLTLLRKNIAKDLEENPDFATYAEPLKKLLPYIVGAYLECAVESCMPAYTPELILLGLLYKKTNLNRDTVEIYYKRLLEKINCLNIPADWQEWKKDTFKASDLATIKKELEGTSVSNENVQSLYEKFVFEQLSPTGFPPDISYSNAKITNGTQSASFADCMDSTVRNVINFLSYNQQTGLFDTALLAQRIGTTIYPSLKTFYDKNATPASAGETAVHSDWAQIAISNIPFVSYNSALPRKAKTSDLGYIKINGAVSPELETFLKDKKYTVLSDSETAYELNPSMKNLIIVLNHLLGLNLFAEEPLEKAFIRPDFVEFYLPKLATALKASLPASFIEKDLKEIDKRDYSSTEVKLPLNFSFSEPEYYAVNLTLQTTSGHGQFFSTSSKEFAQTLQPTLTLLEQYPISIILLIDNPAILPNTDTTFLWLFSRSIDNPDSANYLLNNYIAFNKNILDLFLFIAEKHPDEARKPQMILKIYSHAIEQGIAKNDAIKEAIQAAQEGIKSTDSSTKNQALRLFKTLVEKDKAFYEAIQAAQEGMKSTDSCIRGSALELFRTLVRKGKAFDEAAIAAQEGIKDTNTTVQASALNLFQVLVLKGKAFDEAAIAAQEGMDFTDYYTRSSAINLFKALFEKDKAFEQAIMAAQKGIKSTNNSIRSTALQLFKALVEKDKGIVEAINAAQDGMKIGLLYKILHYIIPTKIDEAYSNIQCTALELFKVLVKKNKAFDQAFEAAQKGINSTEDDVKETAKELMKLIRETFTLKTTSKKLIQKEPHLIKKTKQALQNLKLIKEITPAAPIAVTP